MPDYLKIVPSTGEGSIAEPREYNGAPIQVGEMVIMSRPVFDALLAEAEFRGREQATQQHA